MKKTEPKPISLTEFGMKIKDHGVVTHACDVTLDSVCCTALCMYILKHICGQYQELQLTRIELDSYEPVPEEFKESIMYCTGSGKYDCTTTFAFRRDKLRYSSFGLLWKDFGKQLVGKKYAEEFDQSFVRYVDLSALGMETPLDLYIDCYPGKYVSTEYFESDQHFMELSRIMLSILTVIFNRYLEMGDE